VKLGIPARRRLAVAATIACVAIGVPAVALASSAGARSEAAAACNQSDTYVWFALAPNGAAGTIYYPVEFTNVGSKPCTLTGFPGVSAVNSADHQVGKPARELKTTVHTITVKPDQTVNALLGIVETGAACPASGQSVTADGLKVYPPNEKGAQFVLDFSFSVCAKTVSLDVYPVVKGIGVP